MPQQLLFQHSAGLKEQAAGNGFVRHAQASVLGILILQPSGNLFRRPVQKQFARNARSELLVDSQQAGLGPQGRLPGLVIGFTGSVLRTAAMADTSRLTVDTARCRRLAMSESTRRKRSRGRCLLAPPG